ncbi:hypothetical protein H3H54_14495 [Brachybacterium sp. Z12]|uniref:hypothetical protein n=1 Tax=Brachybacterium sp. Z12 TaxID=2759167 RepID=UPI001862A4AF|nr:hypothetical protein [Brachybacterium sp. Z12]QNN82266.1 hypothetical protein H3H54_14495 [Brachybacterium sp. Z12]
MNDQSDGMVVLMSNAVVPGREDRQFPAFHRWSWAMSWPDSHVLAIADPALRDNPALDGAWYLDATHDTIHAVAEVVAVEAEHRGIPLDRVIYYGSSLGGFAALCAASVTRCHAVVEVPQIDFQNWFPGAIKRVEEHVLQGSIMELRAQHPERVDVWERFLYEGHIPSFTILTNELDKSFQDQLELVSQVREHELYSHSRAEVVITAQARGHQVLVKDVATAIVREALDRTREPEAPPSSVSSGEPGVRWWRRRRR